MSNSRLVLIVGPSGTGKDTLLDGAKSALAGDTRLVFPKRVITRPTSAGGEDHQACTMVEFEAMKARGEFAFHWRAHGLRYGIPIHVLQSLALGRVVVFNGSRATLPELRARFDGLAVVAITTPESLLRQRLRDRGRESEAEIEARLERARAFTVNGPDVVQLSNDANISDGIQRLVDILQSCCPMAVTKAP